MRMSDIGKIKATDAKSITPEETSSSCDEIEEMLKHTHEAAAELTASIYDIFRDYKMRRAVADRISNDTMAYERSGA